MKKYVLSIIFLLLFFGNMKFLHADCEELLKETSDVKVYKITRIPRYEELGGEEVETDFLIGVGIEGLDDKFYATVTNSYNDKAVTVKSEDAVDGIIEVSVPYIYKSVKMTVNFYSNDSNLCSSTDTLKSVSVDTDTFNMYYYFRVCNENPDLDECQPTYDSSGYSDEKEFLEVVNKVLEEKNKSFLDKSIDFIKSYYLFIIIPILLISAFFIVRIVLLKRRLKNE